MGEKFVDISTGAQINDSNIVNRQTIHIHIHTNKPSIVNKIGTVLNEIFTTNKHHHIKDVENLTDDIIQRDIVRKIKS